jgi:hypothetical protein
MMPLKRNLRATPEPSSLVPYQNPLEAPPPVCVDLAPNLATYERLSVGHARIFLGRARPVPGSQRHSVIMVEVNHSRSSTLSAAFRLCESGDGATAATKKPIPSVK